MVDGEGPNLLGRDWLGKFLANIYTLVTPDKLDQDLKKHFHVFEEGLGTLNNVNGS